MSDQITVRQATLADAEAVAELMTGLNRTLGVSGIEPPHDKAPENVLFTPALTGRRMRAMEAVETVFLGEIDGRAAGFTSLRLVPYLDQDVPYAEVMNLYVRPEDQRKGVARALVEAAERFAENRGATVMRILTGSDNLDAQAFYRAAGYDIPNVSCEKFLKTAKEPLHA